MIRYPIVVDPSSRGRFTGLRELFEYRSLVRLMAARDVKLRFRQTRFGALWLIASPLFFTVGYAFLFGTIGDVDTDSVNSFVFTYAGMSLWGGFSSVFSRTCNCLLGNRELLTHIYFPRLAVPFATTLATQVDVLISWGILVLMLVLAGEPLSTGLLALPLWFAIVTVIACSLGMIVAGWTLAMRDLQQITGMVLAAGPIFIPVAYPPDALPSAFRWLATLNPLTPLFEGVRASAFGQPWPSAGEVLFSVATMIGLATFALIVFGRAERRLADVI